VKLLHFFLPAGLLALPVLAQAIQRADAAGAQAVRVRPGRSARQKPRPVERQACDGAVGVGGAKLKSRSVPMRTRFFVLHRRPSSASPLYEAAALPRGALVTDEADCSALQKRQAGMRDPFFRSKRRPSLSVS
jgi:hypothetical protein